MAPTISGSVSDPAMIRRVLATPATWALVGLSMDATRAGTVVAVVDCFVNSLRVGAFVNEAIANKDRLGPNQYPIQYTRGSAPLSRYHSD